MLRSDLPLRPSSRLAGMLAFILGEPFLGFLAIIAVALTLFPMLFAVSPGAARAIEGALWFIIGLFAVEYALALAWPEE